MSVADTVAAQLALLRRAHGQPKLTSADLFSCAEAIGRLPADGSDRPVQRIAVLGDSTTDLLARAIACAVLQEGVLPQLYVAPSGSMTQEVLDPDSGLHRFRAELVVLAPDWRAAVPPLLLAAQTADIGDQLESQVRHFQSLWNALEQGSCRIIQHMFVPPAWQLRGIADRHAPASVARRVDALNEALAIAGHGRVTWLETDRLAARVGLSAWSAPRYRYAGKLAFDPRFLVDYLPWFRGAWRAACGRAKKVLVLDLDDTLWGGAIGDEGVENIRLGPDHGAIGEAFADWQRYLVMLADRGVILAVCSKNAPALAAAGFDHPYAALKRDDFAAFVCSWEDKAAGLRRIAQDLSVGLDALVFADDNPAETDLVRQFLPEVETVDLGSDAAQFIEHVEAGHWFDLQAYTGEDLNRRESYKVRRHALDSRGAGTDLSVYLKSLEMVGHLAPASAADLPRMAQLELKTNQFNLTTQRYSQARLAEFLALPDRLLLVFSLRDRFGDHGLVSTLVAVQAGPVLKIDGWLMSCRIFARSAEQFILRHLADMARARGCRVVEGEYLPTARNGVVADLYQRLGFEPASPDGRSWRLDLDRPLGQLESMIADAGPESRTA